MTESLIKIRKLAVVGIKDQRDVNRIIESLSQKTGVMEVDVDSREGFIRVRYNLMKINFETIENFIKKLGFGWSRKLNERLKRGMAKFTEQNELDNRSAPSHSCCSDPKETANRCKS